MSNLHSLNGKPLHVTRHKRRREPRQDAAEEGSSSKDKVGSNLADGFEHHRSVCSNTASTEMDAPRTTEAKLFDFNTQGSLARVDLPSQHDHGCSDWGYSWKRVL